MGSSQVLSAGSSPFGRPPSCPTGPNGGAIARSPGLGRRGDPRHVRASCAGSGMSQRHALVTREVAEARPAQKVTPEEVEKPSGGPTHYPLVKGLCHTRLWFELLPMVPGTFTRAATNLV
jgi:hypothetical protein